MLCVRVRTMHCFASFNISGYSPRSWPTLVSLCFQYLDQVISRKINTTPSGCAECVSWSKWIEQMPKSGVGCFDETSLLYNWADSWNPFPSKKDRQWMIFCIESDLLVLQAVQVARSRDVPSLRSYRFIVLQIKNKQRNSERRHLRAFIRTVGCLPCFYQSQVLITA